MITTITGLAALVLFPIAITVSLAIIVPGLARAIDVVATGRVE